MMNYNHDTSGWVEDLKPHFNGMDVADNAGAVAAMQSASTILGKHHLSFRQLVQLIEAQRLLLPLKIASAIQLMDSNTLLESESAFLGARRMMRSCGLTFGQIVAALAIQRPEPDEFEQLRMAYVLETQRVQTLRCEVEQLRRRESPSKVASTHAPGKAMVLSAFALCCTWFAALTIWPIAQPLQSEKTARRITTSISTPAALGTPVVQSTVAPVILTSPAVPQNQPALHSARETPRNCWRDRSIQGHCFH